MRITGITCNYCGSQAKFCNQTAIKHNHHPMVNHSTSFQGNGGKYIGGLIGFIAITAICPAITIAGLGGLGVIAGMAAGSVIDDKIEEKQESVNKK